MIDISKVLVSTLIAWVATGGPLTQVKVSRGATHQGQCIVGGCRNGDSLEIEKMLIFVASIIVSEVDADFLPASSQFTAKMNGLITISCNC